MMRRLLREPLLHFLVLGAVLFATYNAINGSVNREDHIVVTVGQVEHFAIGFTRSWRRPPTVEELSDLVRAHVREEVFYREAKALGLDRDDPIIRRRLQQKLEFLSEDIAAQTEPSESDLNALLQSQSEKLRTGRSFTFSHVYLNPERHSENINEAAAHLLTQMNRKGANADASAVGDRFLLGNEFRSIPSTEVAKLFGASFVEQLAGLNAGVWQGPVKSGYGVHLVFLQERTDGRIPSLDEVREELRREWKELQRNKANEAAFDKLLSRYVVTVEGPKTATGDAKNTAWVQQ